MDGNRTGILCFLKKDNQILLTRTQYPDGQLLWTGISGYVEPGESLVQAVIRECEEETEILIDPTTLRQVAKLQLQSLILHVFFTEVWQGTIRAKDPTLTDFRWFTRETLPFESMHPGTEQWLPQLLD